MKTGLLATLAPIGLVVGVVACAGCATLGPRSETSAPACAPGSLVFAPPYLPSGVAFSRAGDALVVVDRGALTVRDPATLAVTRTLLPTIDHWSAAFFSADGAALRAETVDGLRFSFDMRTCRATRLPDDRAAEPHHAIENDEMNWYAQRIVGVAEGAKRGQGAGAWFLQSLGLPALPKGAEAVAFALAAVRTREGRTTLEALELREAGADAHGLRGVLADSKGILHLYDAERELHRSDALAGTTIAALAISGERVVVGLTTGEVAIFRPDLALESRFMVRRPPPFESPSVRLSREEKGAVHGFRALDLDRARRRLAWVSTDLVVGVFDVEARRALAEVRGTGAQLTAALWLDERRVAVHAFDRLTIWDTIAGAPLHERKRAFSLVAPTPGGLLGVADGGKGELLDARTLAVLREICFLPAGCAEPPLVRPDWEPKADWNRLSPEAQRWQLDVAKTDRERALDRAAREVHAALAPDGRTLAVLHAPIEVREPATPGDLALWDLTSLARTRTVPLATCYDWKIAYHSADVLDVCEKERRDARTLAVLPGEPEKPDRFANPEEEVTPVGAVDVGVYRAPTADFVGVGRGKNEALLAIAEPEVKGTAPDSQLTEHERLQLRAQTFVAAAPGGRRFLLLGRGKPEKEGWFPGYAVEAGGLQVWCAPDRPVTSEAPAPPEDPPVAEIDGIIERAVDGFPQKVVAAAEAGADVYVLGTDALGKTPSLVAIGPDRSHARAVTLPKGGPWTAVLPAPAGETIWLRGARGVARLERAGGWTTFALDDGDTNLRFFATLSADAAVLVGDHGCSGAEVAASKTEASLRPYFEDHPEKFVEASSGKRHSLAEFAQFAAADHWYPFADNAGCQDVSIVGGAAPVRRSLLAPSSVADYTAWRGGFAGLGNPTLVYQDGAWLDRKAPLAVALGHVGAKEARGAGRSVYLKRGGELEVLDVGSGAIVGTITLELGLIDAIEVTPAGATIFVESAGRMAADAHGRLTGLPLPHAPAWVGYGEPRVAPGQTARVYTTERGLVLLDDGRSTILFGAASRRRGLAERRQPLGE